MGIRIRLPFMKKEVRVLDPPKSKGVGVSFEQMAKAAKWLVRPWRKK